MNRLLPLTLVLLQAVAAQEVKPDRPCIAFSSDSDSATNTLAKEPLEAAVMMSGHFDFYASRHDGCWSVHVLSLPVMSAKGKRVGFVVSHTVTDPQSIEIGHALTFGPDQSIFLQAMNKAAADAIRNIRLTHSNSQMQPIPSRRFSR